jgi:two-component system cell cycle sensor histidine kinase/response regulator CckA
MSLPPPTMRMVKPAKRAGSTKPAHAKPVHVHRLEQDLGLLEAVPDAIVITSAAGSIEFVNQQAERMFGYARAELLGRPVETLVPDRFEATHLAHRATFHAQPARRRMGNDLETTGRRKDGSEFPVDISLAPLMTNKTTRFVAAIRDVSAAVRAQEGLAFLHEVAVSSSGVLDPSTLSRLVEDRARSLLRADGAILLWWDPAKEHLRVLGDTARVPLTHIVVVGEGVAGLAFQRREPVVVEDIANWELASPETLSRGIKSAAAVPLCVLNRPVGVLTVSSMTVRPFRKADIRLLELLAAQVAPALEAAELNDAVLRLRDYQKVFENSPDPMWVEDAETLAILAVNGPAIKRYGYSREEFLATTARELRPPEELPAFLALLASIGLDQPYSRSAVHSAKDGTAFDVEVTWTPSVFGDRQVRIVLAQDVTEKRLQAQQLEQSRRLESLGELAGGVAHDFNNLLGVILNFAAFVKEQLEVAAKAKKGTQWLPVVKDVERIERAAESAARLTQQLLAFARREVVQPRPLDINSEVRDVQSLLRRSLGEHIEFVTSFGGALLPVLMDPGHLEQVLTNLAVNARDAMREGGIITIATAAVEIDEAYAGGHPGLKPGRYVELRVSDTGTGMSTETLQRAFEPFYTTKPKGQGTGLGLATVYGIVTQAGGYISIASELGRGTRVRVLLPTSEQPRPALAKPSPELQPVKQSTATILVVEDNDDLREVVCRILGRAGYSVIIAAGGPEALEAEKAHDGDIHLLLTDVVMPKMQGNELAQQLTAIRPGLRVLYMSGYAQPSPADASGPGSRVGLLDKPFTEAVLLARVRKALAARS